MGGMDRHFVKEDLPRIRYANPAIDIQVNRLPKSREDTWQPEMVMEFGESTSCTLSLVTISYCDGRTSHEMYQRTARHGHSI